MRVKNKRVLKNGAVAGYVYYKKDKKWKWRIVGHVKKNKKGGSNCQFDWNKIVFYFCFNDDERIEKIPSRELKSFFEMLNNKYQFWSVFYEIDDIPNILFFESEVKPEVELKSFICESKIGQDYFKNKVYNLNPTNRNGEKMIFFNVNVNYNRSNNNNNNNSNRSINYYWIYSNNNNN